MISDVLSRNLEQSLDVHRRFLTECLPALTEAAAALVSAYRAGRKPVFFWKRRKRG